MSGCLPLSEVLHAEYNHLYPTEQLPDSDKGELDNDDTQPMEQRGQDVNVAWAKPPTTSPAASPPASSNRRSPSAKTTTSPASARSSAPGRKSSR